MANKKIFNARLAALLIGLLIVIGLMLVVGRPHMVSVESDQRQQQVASAEVALIADSMPVSSLERDLDFYRQLSSGDSFALQLGADNSAAVAEVVVTQISREGIIASITGSLSSGQKGSIHMTVGDKFMHVFLSSENGIYEYSGSDFQAVVERTKDMRFENDTAALRNQSVELNDQPVRRAVEFPVSVK